MKKFEEFLKLGIVKKQTPNKERAKSLVKEAEEKKTFLTIVLKNISDEQISPNFVVESCYDIIMELLRAKLFLDGLNAKNSHEAEIAYMNNLGFSESEINFMDELRYNRNGIKYYGIIFDRDYAKKVFEFTNKIYPALKRLVENV